MRRTQRKKLPIFTLLEVLIYTLIFAEVLRKVESTWKAIIIFNKIIDSNVSIGSDGAV
jgi:type II secretory pathway component PulJ